MEQGNADDAPPRRWGERLDFWLLTGVLASLLVALLGVQALFLSVFGVLLLTFLAVPLFWRDFKEKSLSSLKSAAAAAGPRLSQRRWIWNLIGGLLLLFLLVQFVGATSALLSALLCLIWGEQNPQIPFGWLWPLYAPLGALLGVALWWASRSIGGRHRAS